jgi:hypothetical protein
MELYPGPMLQPPTVGQTYFFLTSSDGRSDLLFLGQFRREVNLAKVLGIEPVLESL